MSSEVHIPQAEEKARECSPQTEEERTKLLKMSEISLWIDTYDDIFSDFDPRPYSQRALSDDFLLEAKKASREKTSGKIELIFLIPEERRNSELETVIRKRLHEHFRKHAVMLAEEVGRIRSKGIKMVLAGFALLATSTYIVWKAAESFEISLLRVITEPSGWFLSWEGMNHILYAPKQKIADLEFYKKMASCDIEFYPLTCQVEAHNKGKK